MAEPTYRYKPVWDVFLRTAHWWNTVTLGLQLVTGTVIILLGEEIEGAARDKLLFIHLAFGYLFGAGLFTRLLWLSVGPRTARLNDMLPLSPYQRRVFVDTLRYYAGRLKGEPPLYFAHNSFAGIIYVAFFAVAAAQILTGTMIFNTPEHMREELFAIELHEAGYFFILFFVAAHLFAVFVHELVERHGIISAMVHGRKAFTEEDIETLKAEGGMYERKD
ncbi:MAG: cytochrome b/b6 domain-containing protein [Thermodesulfobacteriota bacterium]